MIMSTTTNNFSVEALVAKYRKYVFENAPKTQFNGEELIPDLNDISADEQLIATLYNVVTGDKADKSVVKILSEYANSFFKDALTEKEFSFLCDHFSEMVSYEFDHRDEWTVHGHFPALSKEIIRLVKENVNPKKDLTIFIANAEYCDLAIQFPECTIKGFTTFFHPDKTTWALGQIRMFAAGMKSEIVHGEMINTGEYEDFRWDKDDSETWQKPIQKFVFELPEMNSVDVVIWGACSELSRSRLKRNSEIEKFYDLLKPNGKMLFFSDSITDMVGNEVGEFIHFRDRIIKEKTLSSIVAYEDDSVYSSNKKELHTLLIVDKQPNVNVCVKNEKNGSCVNLSVDQMNGDILWPNYYLTSRPYDGVPLSSLVNLKEDDYSELGKIDYDDDNDMIKISLPEEFSNMSVIYPMDFGYEYKDADLMSKDIISISKIIRNKEWVPASDFPSNYLITQVTKVEEPCVFLYGWGEKMKVGYLHDKKYDNYLRIKHAVPCLIPNDDIDVRYLAALLLLPEVKQQIVAFCGCTSFDSETFFLILDKIIVPHHNEKERIQFLADVNYDALKSTQEEMKQNHNNYVKAVRMRKHALTQSLSSVSSMMNALNNYRLRKNGRMNDDDRISRVKETTVKEAFEFLTDIIKELMPIIDHLADVEYSFGNSESINIEKYITDYISAHEKGWTNFKAIIQNPVIPNRIMHQSIGNSHEKRIFNKGGLEKMVFFPKKALDRIFDDIVSNAIAHAFTDETRKDYQLCISWYHDGQNLYIEIKNNGNPLPKDRDIDTLFEFGVSTSLHQDGHNGIGCHEIKDIMGRYNGSVQLVSSPDEEYTVKYLLSFRSI